jgi:hypothetical protein
MQPLQSLVHDPAKMAGWQLREARGISDDATVIVGVARNAQGDTVAWLMRSRP